mmetsp:Transcript_4379/g.8774  ORF Transcript_4379/g.8774 Transcript_4379/m.8774 type:complete len:122 (-) Transcript_4379:432-797(-)
MEINKTNDEDIFETSMMWFLNNSLIFFIILLENIRLSTYEFIIHLFKFTINSYFFSDIYWLKNKEFLFNLSFSWLLNTQKNMIYSILIIFKIIHLKIFELKYFLFIIEHLDILINKRLNSC